MTGETTDWETLDWKKELARNITGVDQLAGYAAFTSEELEKLREVEQVHPVNIPRYYLSLINTDDPRDPIRKMCFPDAEELIVAGSMGETTADPYGDDKHDKGNGVLHKYDYTALVVATECCAMHCRHCFRRRIVGRPGNQLLKDFSGAAQYIAEHPEINNVILSGGDPLLLSTPVLQKMLSRLAEIDHLDFVRIGSRIPVTFPIRLFDNELMDVLSAFNEKKPLYIATHFNHVREITPTSTEAVRRLRQCGAIINNQAVLLRDVNDTPEALISLMNRLLGIGITPYYLYQCMPVSRVRHHFQIPLRQGIEIVDAARARLNGYATRFKYILGHDIGKLEICGLSDNNIVLKQIHARSGHDGQASRIILLPLDDSAGWVTL